MAWSLKLHIAIAGTLRLLLICYGRIHDAVFDVRFTDIDYAVFTDAARYVYSGESPYDRSTYRYTPLIAFLLVPGISMDATEFGKIIFTIFDLVSALLVHGIVLRETRGDEGKATFSACIVLYNPFAAVISARGNAESLLSMVVLSTVYLLGDDSKPITKWRWISASIVHGLAIHLKIYPLIYSPSVFLYLSSIRKDTTLKRGVWSVVTNYRGYVYGFVTVAIFGALTLTFYCIYGRTFLDEALLYHISRRDVKHNFSPYFYPLYLTQDSPNWDWIGSVAFIPQLLLILFFSFRYYDDLPFGWFASTFAFVTFNKVCTSQYFVWYLILVPLIWYKVCLERTVLTKLVVAWVTTQALWLALAYLLEFRGFNVFIYVWMASLLFLVANCWVLASCVRAYDKQKSVRLNTDKKAS